MRWKMHAEDAQIAIKKKKRVVFYTVQSRSEDYNIMSAILTMNFFRKRCSLFWNPMWIVHCSVFSAYFQRSPRVTHVNDQIEIFEVTPRVETCLRTFNATLKYYIIIYANTRLMQNEHCSIDFRKSLRTTVWFILEFCFQWTT